jgi:hypothetical protein
MRVLVAGSTTWTDREAIRQELSKLAPGSSVIAGDSPGADALALEEARSLGLVAVPMAKSKQDYARYRRAAWKGLNERMLAAGVNRVLVFHPAIEKSRGSKHLIELANAAGVEVQLVSGESPTEFKSNQA